MINSISTEQLLDFLKRLAEVLTGTPDEILIRNILQEDIASDELPETISVVDDVLRRQTFMRLTPEQTIDLIDSGRNDVIREEAVRALDAIKLLGEWRLIF